MVQSKLLTLTSCLHSQLPVLHHYPHLQGATKSRKKKAKRKRRLDSPEPSLAPEAEDTSEASSRALKAVAAAARRAEAEQVRLERIRVLASTALSSVSPVHSAGSLLKSVPQTELGMQAPLSALQPLKHAVASYSSETCDSALRADAASAPSTLQISPTFHNRETCLITGERAIAQRLSTATLAAMLISTHLFGRAYDPWKHGGWVPPETAQKFRSAYVAVHGNDDDFSFSVRL